ncbi:MAG: phosphohydrolase [bacterium]|nr:phosphohydrolase [bacterium]
MEREEAVKIVNDLVESKNIRYHCLAAEAAMIALYGHFEKQGKVDAGTRQDWGIVGLLHDADYEVTNKSLELHTQETTKKLKEVGAPKEIIDAVRGHADKESRETLMAKAIYAADEMTGLIVAAALVRPDKKLEGLTAESVLKRFKEPAFARSANREQIKTCENELGISLPEFTEVILNSMKEISKEIGL